MLELNNVSIAYDNQVVVNKLSCQFIKHKITTIIGPNGCGKSTLLKAISKGKRINAGSISLNGKPLMKIKYKELAKIIALLPQNPQIPYSITAKQLITLGRYPFHKWNSGLSGADKEVIERVIKQTNIVNLQEKYLHEMSGGEKQRAWIAMTLAQEPQLLLLDEPTTFLDINHQYETLELIKKLNEQQKITIVMVLHDINQAARYSDNIIVMNKGQVKAQGSVTDVINEQLIQQVFKLKTKIILDEINNKPIIIPI
ncbi:ABC transporter ATP-binding protein [Clostridium sp. 'deep sea']|uniref:ABC transporter ATP-binding protein n=1 Tax=Clostridium sp. 'deep sea' TaxID=2779445 RepID=UPI0018963ED3|nr:ABC transporter ATP-binding protein [Clostridium sp. 'deep sea']QOR36728.1 ABC transporter ATP-binding protein [Clostridium sp. 'deep sea']